MPAGYDGSVRGNFDPEKLKALDDEGMHQTEDIAMSDMEQQNIEDEWMRRGYLEMKELPDGSLQPRWKGPYRR